MTGQSKVKPGCSMHKCILIYKWKIELVHQEIIDHFAPWKNHVVFKMQDGDLTIRFGKMKEFRLGKDEAVLPITWDTELKNRFIRELTAIHQKDSVDYEKLASTYLNDMTINGYIRIAFPIGEDTDGDLIEEERTIKVDEMKTFLSPRAISFVDKEAERVSHLPPYTPGSRVYRPYNTDALSVGQIRQILEEHGVKSTDEDAKMLMDFHLPNYLKLDENLLSHGQYHVRIPLEFDRYAEDVIYPDQLDKYLNPEIIPHTAESEKAASRGSDSNGKKSYNELLHRSDMEMQEALQLYDFDVSDEDDLSRLFNEKLPNYFYRDLVVFEKDGTPIGNRKAVDKLQMKQRVERLAVNGYNRVMIMDRLGEEHDWLVTSDTVGSYFMHTSYRLVPHTKETAEDADSRPTESELHMKIRTVNREELHAKLRENYDDQYSAWLKYFKSDDAQYNQSLEWFRKRTVQYLTNHQRSLEHGEVRFSVVEWDFFINGAAYVEYMRISTNKHSGESSAYIHRAYVDVRDLSRITKSYRIMPIQNDTDRMMSIISGDIVPNLTRTGDLFE